jgi:phosphatidylglycerophosphate synthase
VAQVTSDGAVRTESFAESLSRLRQAQKSSKGAPPYSLFVNRPMGRFFAAVAYQIGLTPNQVTYVSAVFTFGSLLLLGVAPARWWVGLLVTVGLVLGYAFDAADGQLARLRGGGSMVGEWLDHIIDSIKVAALHLVVLITIYRHFDLDPAWLLVPIGFAAVSSVHFSGMLLVDLLGRSRRATLGLPNPAPQPGNLVMTLLKLPTDYGVFCLVFLFLGAHLVFFVIYTVLAVATAGYTALVILKWRRDVAALDALETSLTSVRKES